jgi:hypothetical protein
VICERWNIGSHIDDQLVAVDRENGDCQSHRLIVLVERDPEGGEDGGVVADAEVGWFCGIDPSIGT